MLPKYQLNLPSWSLLISRDWRPSARVQPPLFHRHNYHHRHHHSEMDRPAKKPKLSPEHHFPTANADASISSSSTPAENGLVSLHRSITPPPFRRRESSIQASQAPHHKEQEQKQKQQQQQQSKPTVLLPSPIQLTHIRDLPPSSGNNAETVQLRDILGDPMIRECWQFNYLFDVDYLMSQFDEDVRGLVQVKVVHGSWKRDAPHRIRVDVLPFSILRAIVRSAMIGLIMIGAMLKISQRGTDNCIHA